MTTKYIVKKCNLIHFAQSIDIGIDLITNSDKIKKSILREPIQNIENTSIKDFKPENNMCVIVELAYKTTIQKNILEDSNEDYNKIFTFCESLSLEDIKMSKIEIQECLSIFKNLCEDRKYLQNKEMKIKFLDFLILIYPELESSVLKNDIIDILKFNSISLPSDLLQKYPLVKKQITQTVIIPTDEFTDIEITVDSNAEGLSSSMYETSQEDLKKASTGNSSSLDAFTKGTFTVLRGRKHANIENVTLKQNHDVLNLLASNGVICTPITKEKLNIDILVQKLAECNNFDICFVHPSLEQKSVTFDNPTEFFKPEYQLQTGELIAVVYRYMLINFFGMHSIINEDKLEYQYLF
jgi:hypothetical protein